MANAKWRNFTRYEIERFVQESYSYSSLAVKLGYSVIGGSYLNAMKSMILELNLDVSHFTGQSWNKDNFNYERFKYGVAIKTSHAIDALIHIRGHKCECCEQIEWLGQQIPLEVHHKDGDSLNNEMSNLELLCPNCHALTKNYRGRNINRGIVKVSDDDFANALKNSDNIRQGLKQLGLTPRGDNYQRARDIIFKYNITHLMQEHQDGKPFE